MSNATSYPRKVKVYSGVLLFLVIIFTTTRPSALPGPLIAAVLIAVIALIYGAVRWLLGIAPLPTAKARFASAAITAIAGLLLVLQVTGQLTMRDFFTMLAIFVVGWLYVARFSLSRSP